MKRGTEFKEKYRSRFSYTRFALNPSPLNNDLSTTGEGIRGAVGDVPVTAGTMRVGRCVIGCMLVTEASMRTVSCPLMAEFVFVSGGKWKLNKIVKPYGNVYCLCLSLIRGTWYGLFEVSNYINLSINIHRVNESGFPEIVTHNTKPLFSSSNNVHFILTNLIILWASFSIKTFTYKNKSNKTHQNHRST